MTDDQRAHLQMIQGVIARMASNSFALKGWSVSIAAALLAFAAGTKNQWVALVGLVPAAVFWGLDGYFLALEQQYRGLYNDAAWLTHPPPASPPRVYAMNASGYAKPRHWLVAAWSPSVRWFHLAVILSVVGIAGIAWWLGRSAPAEPKGLTAADTITVRVVPAPPRR